MYKVLISHHFKQQLKRLGKKDPALKESLGTTLRNIDESLLISIGKRLYKMRIQKSGKGKSGGYRLYVYIFELNNFLTPVCIYAKGDRENISEKELDAHLKKVKIELSML